MMISLGALGGELATEFGDELPDALTTVTTYAAQLDVPGTGEGWRCPDVEVDADTADAIRRAYVMGTVTE